jgi:hypothetical protein
MNRKPDIIIAVDPDVEKSGVAFLEVATRKLEVSSLAFPQLLDYLQFVKTEADNEQLIGGFNPPPKKHIVVVVEAGWLNTAHWHVKNTDNRRVTAAKGNAAGRNHETGRKIVEMAQHYGFETVEQPPLKKIWKGKDGKITHKELSAFTGLSGKTNQETRDAALIAWVYAGLPIKRKQ